MAATKFLDNTGLAYLWSKIKAWANAAFAAISHSHGNITNDGKLGTASRAVITDSNKKIAVSSITSTELGYVSGVTSAIQTQLNGKAASNHNQASNTINAMTGYSKPNSGSAIAVSDSLNSAIGKLEAKVDAVDDSNYVHKTGTELIEGIKKFKENYSRVLHTTMQRNVTPSSNLYGGYLYLDKDDNGLGTMEFSQRSDGSYDFKLCCYDQVQSVTAGENIVGPYLYVGRDANGINYVNCTPTSDQRGADGDVLTRNWIPKDTRIVHTTGNENIYGIKNFFNRDLRIKSNTIEKGVTPSESLFATIPFLDKNGSWLGMVDFIQRSTGGCDLKLGCYNQSTNKLVCLYCGTDANGIDFTQATSTSTSRNVDTDIITRDFIPKDTRIVHTTGNETIAGVKTFTNYIRFKSFSPDIVFINTNLTKGTNPSTYMWNELLFCDGSEDSSDVHRIGGMHAYVNGDGQTSMQFRVHNWVAGSTDFAVLGIYYPKNGTPYTIAPTPAISDNSTKIATTEWVNLKGFVDTTNTQTINGSKTFTSTIEIKRGNPYLYLTETDWEKGTPQGPNSNSYQGIQFREKNSTFAGCIYYNYMPSKASGIHLSVANMTSASATGEADVWLFWNTDNSKAFRPGTNNDVLLGWSNYRWKEVWCTQSSINSTSDERIKDEIDVIPNDILDAWDDVNWIQFKYKDALQEKGNNARLHNGLIAQEIDRVFKSKNLDISKYGLFLYDSWEEVSEEKDNDGNIIQHYMPAGDSYGLRYVEALCMEAAYQRRKNKILENRISELEKRLAKLEGIV